MWFKPSERMPKHKQNILVLFRYGYDNTLLLTAYRFYEWEVKNGTWKSHGEETLYWMPVPELPDVYKYSPWISPAQLPGDYQEVLVHYEFDGDSFFSRTMFFSGDLVNGVWHYGKGKVLHWMPVPTYPEELRNEQI